MVTVPATSTVTACQGTVGTMAKLSTSTLGTVTVVVVIDFIEVTCSAILAWRRFVAEPKLVGGINQRARNGHDGDED